MHYTHYYIILYCNRAYDLSVQDYLGGKNKFEVGAKCSFDLMQGSISHLTAWGLSWYLGGVDEYVRVWKGEQNNSFFFVFQFLLSFISGFQNRRISCLLQEIANKQ